jgi:hypothetical protein
MAMANLPNLRFKRRKRCRVNSGWYLWIDPIFGRVWTSEDHSHSPSEDGGICVKKIWYGVHRLKKRNKDPKRIFRGCKLARYWESEWGRTHFVHGMKNGRLKRTLEDRDRNNRDI